MVTKPKLTINTNKYENINPRLINVNNNNNIYDHQVERLKNDWSMTMFMKTRETKKKIKISTAVRKRGY